MVAMSIDKIKMLEDRITEVMEYIKKLQKERIDLEQSLQEKDKALKDMQQEIVSYKKFEDECNRMKDEKGEVRSRIEKILDALKGVGGAQ
ncbi:MAG: hypothetical protein HZA12_01210 [Nitrospirae bacterium]|nr:hypothetical protein [Nitrospirota bacterium]